MSRPVILAIDGNSLVHRSFHAHARTGMHTEDGRPGWAVRGLLMQLVAAVERIRPSLVVVGFDDPDRSLRRDRWPQYKAQRGDKLDTLVDQLAAAVEVMRTLGLAVVVPEGLEADDVLASAAAFAKTRGACTVIATSDRDAFALIDDNTRVLRIINGGVDASPMMTADRLELLLGIRPEQYRDFAALRGDASDNLPGVPGIGPRTAAKLLQKLGSASAAFDDPHAAAHVLGKSVATRLAADGARERWELNCQVMAMRADITLEVELGRGPGVLPLPPEAVSTAFAAHQLTWTSRDALRVLAETEPGPVPPPRVSSLPPVFDRMPSTNYRRAALPRLVPCEPQPAQLSLFD